MRVKDIMTPNLVTIRPGSYLEEAARLMQLQDVGMVPVVEGNRVLGVITDRDIVIRAMAKGWNPLLTEAREIMSEEVAWCFESTPIEEVAHLMAQKQVRRLLVYNREMYLTGVVSLDDVAVAMRDANAVGEMLRDVSCPIVAHRAVA